MAERYKPSTRAIDIDAAAGTAFTQTYATADPTLGAFTSSVIGSMSGIDNAQAGTPYATLTDLNNLRAAVMTLQTWTTDVAQMLNSVIDSLQTQDVVR